MNIKKLQGIHRETKIEIKAQEKFLPEIKILFVL